MNEPKEKSPRLAGSGDSGKNNENQAHDTSFPDPLLAWFRLCENFRRFKLKQKRCKRGGCRHV